MDVPVNAAVITCGDFEPALTLPRVTVAEAFQRTLKSLLDARNLTQTQLAEMAGLDISTISRLIGGSRVDRFDSLEKIRVAFGLSPAELFDEPRALAALGLSRISDTSTTYGHTLGNTLGSPSPTVQAEGVSTLAHPDPELFAALSAYWADMTPEARLELVGHGHRLRKGPSLGVAPVGFARG